MLFEIFRKTKKKATLFCLFCFFAFSQKVLLLLVEKGLSREKAYSLVQKNAHQAWNNENGNFKQNIEQDPEIMELVNENDLRECFDPSIHLNNLNVIWEKLSI